MYCPKCRKYTQCAHIGTRMTKHFEVPIWEVQVQCLECSYIIWLPARPPTEEK